MIIFFVLVVFVAEPKNYHHYYYVEEWETAACTYVVVNNFISLQSFGTIQEENGWFFLEKNSPFIRIILVHINNNALLNWN